MSAWAYGGTAELVATRGRWLIARCPFPTCGATHCHDRSSAGSREVLAVCSTPTRPRTYAMPPIGDHSERNPIPLHRKRDNHRPGRTAPRSWIANRWLRGEVERLEAELATRQALVSQLLAEQVQNA